MYIFFNLFNYINDIWVLNLFNKQDFIYWINLYNCIKYLCYKKVKYLSLQLYYYIIQSYLFLIFNNMPNKFFSYIYKGFDTIKNVLKNFMIYFLKNSIIKCGQIIWDFFYRFHNLEYMRFMFFILFFILFFLMWKRRNTYNKRTIILNLFIFYVLATAISLILMPLFYNEFLCIIISLLLAFMYIYLRLN